MNRLRERTRKLQKLIKMNDPLPKELVVADAGTHFFQYGLTFFRDSDIEPKIYFNPYFILFMEILYFVRSLVSLFVPITERQYFVYAGDFMFFIRAKTHINVAATQYMMLGINILVLNYVHYRCHILPVYMKPFHFLAGKITVAQSGLRNSEFILSIVRKAKVAFRVTSSNTSVVFWVSLVLSLVPAALNFTAVETVVFGIPWSVAFAVSSYYTFSSYFWHMTYFYILCHFIKYRIRETNHAVDKALQQRPMAKWQVRHFERKYVSISNEVSLYDSVYWCKYLFIAITFLSTFNNTVMYTALFVDMNIVVKVSLCYATILSSSAIFFVLNTASVVYHESSRIPQVLYSATKTVHNVSGLLKIESVIEALSTRKIGFHFLNLFIINYSRFYEIFSLLIAYFLKIIELSRGN